MLPIKPRPLLPWRKRSNLKCRIQAAKEAAQSLGQQAAYALKSLQLPQI